MVVEILVARQLSRNRPHISDRGTIRLMDLERPPLQFVRAQHDRRRCHVIVQLIHRSWPNDRTCHTRNRQTPRNRKLAAADPTRVGEFVHAFHYRPLTSGEIGLILSCIPSSRWNLSPTSRIRPRQSSSRQGSPANRRDFVLSAEWQHFRFNPPIDDVQLRCSTSNRAVPNSFAT